MMRQKELPGALKKELEELFGERVRFNKVERLEIGRAHV